MSHAGSGRTKRVFHLTSLRPRKKSTRSKISRKEARGNGLTTDTGESWKVKRRRIACTIQTGDDNVEGETFDSAGIEASEEDGGFGAIRTDKGKGREVAPRHGDNTVVTGEQSSLKSSASGPELPIPSSVSLSSLSLFNPRVNISSKDLLQCIHHFASRYYSERDQLLNASKEYRMERKQKRLQRQNSIPMSSPTSPSQDQGSTEAEDSASERSTVSILRNGGGDQSDKRLRRDMYRTMDGTVLMAISQFLSSFPRTPFIRLCCASQVCCCRSMWLINSRRTCQMSGTKKCFSLNRKVVEKTRLLGNAPHRRHRKQAEVPL
jgi:hypothetical protein